MRVERFIRIVGPWLLALGLITQTSSARALDLRLGVKGVLTLSGMIGVEPADIELPPWHDSSVGAGGGGGIYADLHFNRLIALELDALFESNRIYFESYSSAAFLEQAVVYEQLRIPLLFKLVSQLSRRVDFTGGIGPELLIGTGATPHTAETPPPTKPDRFFFADEQVGLAMTAAFGFGFYTKYLHIPVELRFGYNMLGAYSYRDRVDQFGPQLYALRAMENFQFSLLVGLGFRIPPEKPPKPPKPVVKQVDEDDPFYYPEPPEGRPRIPRQAW